MKRLVILLFILNFSLDAKVVFQNSSGKDMNLSITTNFGSNSSTVNKLLKDSEAYDHVNKFNVIEFSATSCGNNNKTLGKIKKDNSDVVFYLDSDKKLKYKVYD